MPFIVDSAGPGPLRAIFRKLPLEKGQAFLFRESWAPAFSVWHYHPEYELSLLESAGGICFVGDSITRLDTVSILLLGPNLPHFWRFDKAPSGASPHALGIHFSPGFFVPEFFKFPELSGIPRLLNLAKRGVTFVGQSRDAFAKRILALRELNQTEKLLAILDLLQKMTESPEKTLLSSADFAPVLDQRSCERIQHAYQFIYENFQEPIGLEAVSRAVGMSPHAFCRYFKHVTGHNLMDVIADIRVHHAARLLIETDETIGNICFDSGFASLSCFNRRFRRIKRLNPKEFRMRYNSLAESHPSGSGDPRRTETPPAGRS